jgi:hypothetical protein
MKIIVVENVLTPEIRKHIAAGSNDVTFIDNMVDLWSSLSDGNACDVIIANLKGYPMHYADLMKNIENTLLKDIPVITISAPDKLLLQLFTLAQRSFEIAAISAPEPLEKSSD